MAVLFKDGVRVKRLTPALLRIFTVVMQADAYFAEDMVITSVNDSTAHMPTSAHYRDEAIDLRCNDRPRHVDLDLKRFLEGTLGPKFTVLLESAGTPNEHLHIQLKQGRVWP